jgi:hypothetical protein
MTGGAARVAIKPNSKKARTANASEKQLKVQRAQLRQMKKGSTAADIEYLANADPSTVKWAMIIVFGLIYLVLAFTYPVLWIVLVLIIGVTILSKHHAKRVNRSRLCTAATLEQHCLEREAQKKGSNLQATLARPPTAQDRGHGDVAERLRQLNELHEAGLLTDDEFASKRAGVVDTL